MATGSILPISLRGDMAISGEGGHSPFSRDFIAAIVQRSAGKPDTENPSRLDTKRLVERAIEIDTAEPGRALTEGQWDFGLDMLARAEAPPEGTGLADRQERIIAALSKALAEM